jgi:multiple sugar transport system substrate-binding protein
MRGTRQTRRWYLQRLGTAVGGAGAITAACGPLDSAPARQGAPAVGGCRTTIEVWGYGIGGDVMKKLVADFTAKNTACTILATDQADDASGTVQAKLTTAQVGGAPPTLTGLSPSRFRTWTDPGLITDVDEYFRRDRLSKDDFPPALWASMSYGGKVRALPFRANPDFVMHWLKPHFQEIGLPPDRGPQTIADLDRMIPMLHRDRGGDLERVGMQPWDFYGTGSNTLNAWGRAFGGSFYDAAKDELTFNHPRVVRAVEWYVEWARRLDATRILAAATAFNATSPTTPFFVTRKWSMHPLTPSWLNLTKTADPALATPEMIGSAPFPAEAPGKPGTVTVGGWGIAMATGAKEREAGWEFMKYVGASEEGTTTIARMNGLPGWLKSPGLAEVAKDPLQKPYVEAIQRAEFAQFGFYVPVSVNYAPLDEAIAGKRTAREALDAMQREATVLYDDYKQRFKTQRGS